MDHIAPLDLAGNLCARVCHDLAGTIGALSGTLDMLAEAPDPDALALAQDCAQDLTARLRLIRAAWGADAEIPDLDVLLPGLPNAAKLAIRTDLPADATHAHRQLAACLLMLAAAALPLGGSIVLAGTVTHLTLRIEGRRTAWPTADLDPRGIVAAMAALRAQALGLELRVLSETDVELRAT